jgi:hypothetical protein
MVNPSGLGDGMGDGEMKGSGGVRDMGLNSTSGIASTNLGPSSVVFISSLIADRADMALRLPRRRNLGRENIGSDADRRWCLLSRRLSSSTGSWVMEELCHS